MSKYVFLARVDEKYEKRCIYIEEQHHRDIVDNIIFHGASWCGFEETYRMLIENDKFESYLTKEEIIDLLDNKDSYEKYIEKLTSEQGVAFKNKIMEDEHEYLKEQYNLDDEDMANILDSYYLNYEDRDIVCCVYEDAEQLGREMVENCYNVEEPIKEYIDYERLGNDIADGESYLRLKDGRIVEFYY